MDLSQNTKILIKLSEMKVRGFEDAFIVTYKNGERINISTIITTQKRNRKIKQETETVIIEENKILNIIYSLLYKLEFGIKI